jgi:CheY-like chemotaxis protein
MARILLVEDNELNRDMLTRRLKRQGHDVVVAVNGQEAIELAIQVNPDLILMDMSLPEVDGWQATREIKSRPDTQNIPILALTAHALEEDRERSYDAGVDDYDTKPVRFPRLQDKIKTLLEENPELRDRYVSR